MKWEQFFQDLYILSGNFFCDKVSAVVFLPRDKIQRQNKSSQVFCRKKYNKKLNFQRQNKYYDYFYHYSFCCIISVTSFGIYLLKVNNRDTRTRCEICFKLTIKTPEPSQWRRCNVIIVNFEHISHLVLVSLLLTLSR